MASPTALPYPPAEPDGYDHGACGARLVWSSGLVGAQPCCFLPPLFSTFSSAGAGKLRRTVPLVKVRPAAPPCRSLNSVVWCRMSQEDSTSAATAGAAQQPTSKPAPKLNERILSSLSRRAVAAHPWHDLEIGEEDQPFLHY
ncbi:hypothetical protein ZWY2020_030706 [Hordeum vulgare]|nr:hypothetical protein ZWY2020_030706 [Hordeum vulgare]